MTGAYLRVKRNEEWLNLEVEHLTDHERKEVLLPQGEDRLLMWLNMACQKLAEIEPLLKGLEEDGIIQAGE